MVDHGSGASESMKPDPYYFSVQIYYEDTDLSLACARPATA